MASAIARPTKTISITSGKGGVGKTTLVANLALQLAKANKRVLLMDGDMGMANLDIFFKVRPERTMVDLIAGNASVEDIIVPVADRVDLLPGGSGVYELQKVTAFEKQILLDQVSSLGDQYDYMLIDTAPGIADHVLYLNSAAQEIIVMVTPDPASIADSYALIKVLNQRCRETRFSVIVNQAKDEAEATRIFQRLDDVARKFLYIGLDLKGHIPADPILRQATKSQQIVSKTYANSPSAMAFATIASRLNGYEKRVECKGGLQFFWEQVMGLA